MRRLLSRAGKRDHARQLDEERIVRVERRPTRWGRGSKIEPEAKNEVLQKAIAWHLVRCGALDGADDAKLRLLARGASEKGAGRHRWNKSFGTTSALLKQYDVVSAVPDDVWVSVPGAPALQGEQFLARLRIDDDDFPELASSELCPDTGFKAS